MLKPKKSAAAIPPDATEDQQCHAGQVNDEDDDGDDGRFTDAGHGEQEEGGEHHHGGDHHRQRMHHAVQVVHGLVATDHGGCHVAQYREACGRARVGLVRRVQEHVVRTTVQWKRSHHLAVDLAEEEQHPGHKGEGDEGPRTGIPDGERTDVQTTARDVVAADRRGGQLTQFLRVVLLKAVG